MRVFSTFLLVATIVELLLPAAAADQPAPNIVLVLTDDQDLLLGSLDFMPAVGQLLAGQGATMAAHFTSTPVCCPSRSSIITGRFPHNYPQAKKHEHTGCMDVTNGGDKEAFFPMLHAAGYSVGLFGKHLNMEGMASYCPKDKHSHGAMPAGVSKYLAMCPDTCYQDCVFAQGHSYGGKTDWVQPTSHFGYHTSIIGNHTLDFIRNSVAAKRPFMAYVAPHAPHHPCTPAPWYTNSPVAAGAPRSKAFNASSPDKHWIVSQQPPLTAGDAAQLDGVFRNRTRTLFSVDDIVHDTVSLLLELGVANNTFVLFTSDHGFHLGQYRLGSAKRQVYDTDLRIPFLVTGPGILKGSSVAAITSHVDLAPTILDMAGVPVPKAMDGVSLLPLMRGSKPGRWRQQVFVEYQGDGINRDQIGRIQRAPNNTYIAIRQAGAENGVNLAYAEFDASENDFSFKDPYFAELYDCSADPEQLTNLAKSVQPDKLHKLKQDLHSMQGCSGSGDDSQTCFPLV